MQTKIVPRQLRCSLTIFQAGVRILGRSLELIVFGSLIGRKVDFDDSLRLLGKGHEVAIGLTALLLHGMTNEEGPHEEIEGTNIMNRTTITVSSTTSGHLAPIVMPHAAREKTEDGVQVVIEADEGNLILQIHNVGVDRRPGDAPFVLRLQGQHRSGVMIER